MGGLFGFVCFFGGVLLREAKYYHCYNLYSNPTNPGCSISPVVSLNLCTVTVTATCMRGYLWAAFFSLSCIFAWFSAFFLLWSTVLSMYILKGFVQRKAFPTAIWTKNSVQTLVKQLVYGQIKHHASCQALYSHLAKIFFIVWTGDSTGGKNV